MTAAVAVSDDHVLAYAVDGVALVRGAISSEWVDELRRGVEANLADPSPRGRVWDRDADGRTCFYDSQAWQRIPQYRRFLEASPIAELAGRVMDVAAVNFFFDAIFVRTPGNRFRTPFHQDEPYWSVEGFDCCSIWMPLVPVARQSALEFVRGSHRWNKRYAQTNFGALTGDARDQVVHAAEGREPFPDIEGHRDDYDILSWDMEPGDCAVFNARTIHGGSGNLAPDRDLRVFNTQWLGDDVRVCFRDEGMDPDHRDVMAAMGLRPGDRVGGDLYPQLWRRHRV